MKQKLASKPQDTLSGKEKLKMLKQMKEASNKPPKQEQQQVPSKKEVSFQSDINYQPKSIPTKAVPQPVQLPFDFFDNVPSAVISTQSNEIPVNSSNTTTANTTSASSFPTGFFDNPYEEKLVIESISSSNVVPPTEVQSDETEEVKAVDGDFEGFMQEIKTISQKIEDQRVANEEEQQQIVEEKEEEEEEQEEENLLVNEEFVEKLRQTTYYTKLGLFYQKLEQATAHNDSSSTAVTSSNDSTINIAQVEKEVQELELLLVQQEALTPSLQKSNFSNGNSGGDIIDQFYLNKVEKKRKHQQLIEAIEEDERQEEEKRRKRSKEMESSNKSNDKEEDNGNDDEDEEDDEEEESHSFV